MNVQVVPSAPEKLWFMSPGGTFWAKNAPFWGFSELLSKMSIIYVFIVVFMVLNSNLKVPIPETLSFARFGVDKVSPLAKTPQKAPKFFKMRLFILQLFRYRLDLSKILPKRGCNCY